jgi:phage I-like protein
MCSAALEPDAAGAYPTEFRIFKAGANVTSKGTTIFDEQAAADVMKHYAQKGVDMMIDLEHESTDEPVRPDSRDARGWFNLEVRNGELWAVNVRWTPDGARRLAEKTQRYISPLFYERKEDGRVAWLVNVALVGDPATHGAVPLVAASEAKVPLSGTLRDTCHAVIVALTQKRKNRKQC